MMSVWSSLVGQDAAVAKLSEAAASARAIVASRGSGRASDEARSMSHAWLITGPPGSGRSVAARAFAAALQCTGETVGCGQCAGCRTTMGRTNADVVFAATETSIINVETARSLVLQAQSSPSQGLWRVIVVEDADRLGESGANALLKAIEEPPEHTVWLLCAPSPDDMIATIRSRCRHLGLRIPTATAVADLLVREGVATPEVALEAARAAQDKMKAEAQAIAADIEHLKAEFEADVAESDEDLRRVIAARRELADRLPADLVEEYEEARRRNGALAVIEVRDGYGIGVAADLSPMELERIRLTPDDELYLTEDTSQIVVRTAANTPR